MKSAAGTDPAAVPRSRPYDLAAPATLVDAHELILQESGYVVSVLTETDIDDYVALVASRVPRGGLEEGVDDRGGPAQRARLDAAMAREMLAEAESTMILVRSVDGPAVASVYLREPVDSVAYLGVLAVSPLGQGQGWARRSSTSPRRGWSNAGVPARCR